MNWTAPEIFIHATDAVGKTKIPALAKKTGLSVTEDPDSGWLLQTSANGLRIVRPDGVSVNVDFIEGKVNRRADESNFRKQPLARALGMNKPFAASTGIARVPRVIDATAGFGTDAWMMASLGCSVTLLEDSSVLCALLNDAIDAALANVATARTAQSMHVIHTKAVDYLTDGSASSADIVYLDPMYPMARKQALVKKGMQFLHELIGPDSNGSELLSSALAKASYRVVVKRPKGADVLSGTENWNGQMTSIDSPNTRFDVYHVGTRR